MKKRLQEVDKAPGGLAPSSSAIGAAPVAASGSEVRGELSFSVLLAWVEHNMVLAISCECISSAIQTVVPKTFLHFAALLRPKWDSLAQADLALSIIRCLTF